MYCAGWVNLCIYLLWLSAMCFLSIDTGSQVFQWVNSHGLLPSFAVFIPSLCFLGSIFLFLQSFRVKKEERTYPIFYNVLMVILWIVSVVAPN